MSELEENLKAFEEQLPRLLESNEGRFTVGRVGDEFSCWDTFGDAHQYGCKIYGLNPFLVKQVIRPEFERPLSIMYTAAA